VTAIESNAIGAQDRVLTIITGSGLKDTRSAIRAAGRPIPIEPDVSAVAEEVKSLSRHCGLL
jgi:threonine synthase